MAYQSIYTGAEIDRRLTAVDGKIPFPSPAYAGLFPMATAQGGIQWVPRGQPTQEQTREAVETYFSTHAIPVPSVYALGNAIIRGGWNQLVKNGNFSEGVTGWAAVSGTIGSTSDGLKITVDAEGKAYVRPVSFVNPYIPAGQKAFVSIKFSAINLTSGNLKFARVTSSGSSADKTIAQADFEGIEAYSVAWSTGIYISGASAGDYVVVKSINTMSLPEIFGAGNEPTAEQFRQLFPDDYYPYATPGFGDLLWENASPTLPFGYQHLTIPALDNYTMYAVVAKLSINAYPESVFFFRTGHSGNAVFANTETAELKTWQRTFTASGSDLLITDAKYSAAGATGADNNNGCIPLYIYGIK